MDLLIPFFGKWTASAANARDSCLTASRNLELVEHEKCPARQAAKCNSVIPMQSTAKVIDGEDTENHECDYLLNHLELVGGEGPSADAICWNLQAILEECNRPANQNNFPQRGGPVLEMTVPREGHEDVRADK